MVKTYRLLTRGQLANRWNCSVRKIDRMRKYGLLPWIDINCGEGSRPTVRFQTSAIQDFESKNLMSINTNSAV